MFSPLIERLYHDKNIKSRLIVSVRYIKLLNSKQLHLFIIEENKKDVYNNILMYLYGYSPAKIYFIEKPFFRAEKSLTKRFFCYIIAMLFRGLV